MTDLAIPEEQRAALARAEQPPAGNIERLADWANEARAAAALATSLCKTPFVPEHFRNQVEAATAAILTGHELGLTPLASLRSIYVIKGTPGMYAHAMRAVVQQHGHEVWVEEASPQRVVVKGRRKGSEHVVESEWTMERAKTAGLTTNQQYQKNPQNMLTARGTAEVCRLIASDALHGVPYAVEELGEPIRARAEVGERVTREEILGIAAEPAAGPHECEHCGCLPPEHATHCPVVQRAIKENLDAWRGREPADGWPETAQPGGGA